MTSRSEETPRGNHILAVIRRTGRFFAHSQSDANAARALERRGLVRVSRHLTGGRFVTLLVQMPEGSP